MSAFAGGDDRPDSVLPDLDPLAGGGRVTREEPAQDGGALGMTMVAGSIEPAFHVEKPGENRETICLRNFFTEVLAKQKSIVYDHRVVDVPTCEPRGEKMAPKSIADEVDTGAVTDSDLREVAKIMKRKIDGRAFTSIPRREITDEVRRASGKDTTRLKADMAKRLTEQLARQGVRVFPPLGETDANGSVRIFHVGTVVADLVDMLETPGPATDRELATVTSKVKWPPELNWTRAASAGVDDGRPSR